MASIFTKIIQGEIPSYKMAENEQFYAFLDINPVTAGHTLVVPKTEIDYFFDLDEQTIAGMMIFAKKIARAMDKVIDCQRVGITVLGLEVPHAHLHLVPLNETGIIDFKNKIDKSRVDFEELAMKIRAEL